MIECNQCGFCCRLFLINLSKEEYLLGKYQTVFGKLSKFKSFVQALKYGAHFLAQKKDGSCVYLVNNVCSIYKDRPQACRGFFCVSKEFKYQRMIKEIDKACKLDFLSCPCQHGVT